MNENIGLFGEAAMGFNIRKITKLYEHYEYDRTYTYYITACLSRRPSARAAATISSAPC